MLGMHLIKEKYPKLEDQKRKRRKKEKCEKWKGKERSSIHK